MLRTRFQEMCRRIARNDETLVQIDEWYCDVVDELFDWSDSDLITLGNSLANGNTHFAALRLAFASRDRNCTSWQAGSAMARGISQSKLRSVEFLHPSALLQQSVFHGAAASSTITTIGFMDAKLNMRQIATLLRNVADAPMNPLYLSVTPKCRITHLSLGFSQLHDMDMLILAIALSNSNSMESLLLEHNCITDIGVLYLCQHWHPNLPLREVKLSWNKLSGTGAVALLHTSVQYPTLQCLQLGGNDKMDFQGLQLIGEQLPHLTALTQLEIYNCVSPSFQPALCRADAQQAATRALAQGLQCNRTLDALLLGGNFLGPRGAQQIMQAVAVHPCLTKLSFRGDESIGYVGLQHIAGELGSTKLTALQLDETVPDSTPRNKKNLQLAKQAGRMLLEGVRQNTTLTLFTFQDLDPKWKNPIQCLVDINKFCRPLLGSNFISPSVWPNIIARLHRHQKHSHVFFCLREQPWLVRGSMYMPSQL